MKTKARPDQLDGMARYGIVTQKRLGISIPDLRKMSQEIGKDHQLALKLWRTGIQEARILAAMVDRPEEVSDRQMDSKAARWVASGAIRELESEAVQKKLKNFL